MAWRNNARLSGRFVKSMFRKWRLPPTDDPRGVPRVVMRALQQETLAADQRTYNLRLQQLLTLHELSKGGN
jgi:hypothetical protein